MFTSTLVGAIGGFGPAGAAKSIGKWGDKVVVRMCRLRKEPSL